MLLGVRLDLLSQGSPLAEERLVRHLGMGFLTCAHVGHQQARVDEGVHDASFLCRQPGERHSAPGNLLALNGDESQQHPQYEVDALVSAAELRHGMVGLPGEGAGHTTETPIELLGDGLSRTRGEIQLLQQIGKQRQRVVRARVVDDGLHDAWREGQAHKDARSLHSLCELAPAERADGDRMLEELGVACSQELSQEVHTQRGEHPDPRILRHAGVEGIKELGAFPLAGESDDLFELIDHNEHAAEPAPTEPGQLRQQ